jgi:type VI secretion system protein ImpK
VRAEPPPESAALARRGTGINALVDAAATLLGLATQLRSLMAHPDPAGLRDHVAREIQTFEAGARNAGVRADLVLAARYGLCTFLDEVVMSTPWGGTTAWSTQSLLSIFHKETFGGEKYFQILERMVQEPARNLELLELYYICLMLGFEGKYQLVERGRAMLEQVQDNLYRTIRGQRGEFERDLSAHWRGVEDRRNVLVRNVPLWVVAACCGLALLGAYVWLSFRLNDASDPVFTRLQGIGREALVPEKMAVAPAPVASAPVVQPEPPPPAFTGFLEPEVKAGLVAILERSGGTAIVIRGDGLFPSGSASVKPELRPLLERIGQELDRVEGKVLVTGHTDDRPIRTLRFPSNWHLSQARAEAVVEMLAARLAERGRLTAEGRADTEPLGGNRTPEERARNRRVEILLLARPGGG